MNEKDQYYKLEAILSEYAGNHDRQLTAWVFGAESEYMPGGWERLERPHAKAMEWAYSDEKDGTLQPFLHEEYGYVWQDIGDDPAWLLAKMEEDPDTNWHGRMIYWHLSENPTDEQWIALRAALDSYKGTESWPNKQNTVTIESLSLRRVTTSIALRIER